MISEGNVRRLLHPATGDALIAPFDAGARYNAFRDLDWERRRFISQTRHGSRVFDLRDFERPHTTRIAESSASGIHLSPDGRLAVVRTLDGHFRGDADMLRVLDPDSGITLAKLMPEGAIVRAVQISPDGNFMAAGYVMKFGHNGRRFLRMWSLRSGRVLWEHDVSDLGGGPRADGFSPDSSVLYSRSEAFDVLTGETVGTIASERSALMTPDARLGVKMIRNRGKQSRIFDWATGETVARLELDIGSQSIESFGISPDSTKICIPDGESEVKVFNLLTGELLGSIAVGSGVQFNATWSADGSRIATSGQDGYIQVWNAESFRLLCVLAGHDSYVLRSRFSRDGRGRSIRSRATGRTASGTRGRRGSRRSSSSVGKRSPMSCARASTRSSVARSMRTRPTRGGCLRRCSSRANGPSSPSRC